MMSVDKFSCATSRFLLPTFRRPSYREIKDIEVNFNSAADVFSTWSKQEGEYYQQINAALLLDDYDVLKENVQFINSLRKAIRENYLRDSIRLYRGLTLSSVDVKAEYKVGLQFLWPTFTATSKNKDIAYSFGDYFFEIEASSDDWTYRSDISQYSVYPQEEEVLFYPYSGFEVKNIFHDAKVIQLKCIDTLEVESKARSSIPETVKIFDESRNMFVYFYKDSPDMHWCDADQPEELFLIEENENGYWDAPYRYHHCNGYFLDKGNDQWEEYQENECVNQFRRVDAD